jgi:hypothetical protein
MRSYLEGKVAAPGSKTEIMVVRDSPTPLYPQELALTSPTSDSRSVGIVRSRTQSTKFFIIIVIYKY